MPDDSTCLSCGRSPKSANWGSLAKKGHISIWKTKAEWHSFFLAVSTMACAVVINFPPLIMDPSDLSCRIPPTSLSERLRRVEQRKQLDRLRVQVCDRKPNRSSARPTEVGLALARFNVHYASADPYLDQELAWTDDTKVWKSTISGEILGGLCSERLRYSRRYAGLAPSLKKRILPAFPVPCNM